MATSTVTITGSKSAIAGGLGGTRPLGPFTWPNNTSASDNFTSQTFVANTFALVTVPANANGVIIYPPSGNAGVVTLKGATGDTGVALHKTNPFALSLDVATSSFGLTSVSGGVWEFEWT